MASQGPGYTCCSQWERWEQFHRSCPALSGALGPDSVWATPGNLNNHIGLPLTALQLVDSDAAVVLEMGMNHFGEIERLCAIAEPQVGLLTNIGTAHAGNLGGVAGVEKAKGELFQGMPAGGTLVVNADDEAIVRQAGLADPALRRVTFGRGAADIRLLSAEATEVGQRLCMGEGERRAEVEVPLVGAHMAQNALAAVAAAVAGGIEFEVAMNGLARVEPTPGRVSLRRSPSGALVLDDTYNANPDSAHAALQTLAERAGERRLVVALGEMLELGPAAADAHAEVGKAAVEAGAQLLFACGELGRAYLEGAVDAGLEEGALTWAADSQALAPLVADAVESNDAVLAKGSRGARMERVVEALLSPASPATGEEA